MGGARGDPRAVVRQGRNSSEPAVWRAAAQQGEAPQAVNGVDRNAAPKSWTREAKEIWQQLPELARLDTRERAVAAREGKVRTLAQSLDGI